MYKDVQTIVSPNKLPKGVDYEDALQLSPPPIGKRYRLHGNGKPRIKLAPAQREYLRHVAQEAGVDYGSLLADYQAGIAKFPYDDILLVERINSHVRETGLPVSEVTYGLTKLTSASFAETVKLYRRLKAHHEKIGEVDSPITLIDVVDSILNGGTLNPFKRDSDTLPEWNGTVRFADLDPKTYQDLVVRGDAVGYDPDECISMEDFMRVASRRERIMGDDDEPLLPSLNEKMPEKDRVWAELAAEETVEPTDVSSTWMTEEGVAEFFGLNELELGESFRKTYGF